MFNISVNCGRSLLRSRRNLVNPVRCFHPTAKREILPIIGLAVVAVVGRYSYLAVQRMNEDYEDYLDELEIFEEKYGPVSDNAVSSMPRGTLGVDLGSSSLKVAFVRRGKNTEPQIIENRDGGRSTPAYIQFDEENLGADNLFPKVCAAGRIAKGRFHERSLRSTVAEMVLKPRTLLFSEDYMDAEIPLQSLISMTLNDALEKVVGAKLISGGKLFSGQESDSLHYVQTVFTYPAVLDKSNYKDVLDLYKKSLTNLYDVSENAEENLIMVPEPICALMAATHFSLIKPACSEKSYDLVIDIGGDALDISLIKNREIRNNKFLPSLGGNLLVEAMSNLMDKSLKESLSSNISVMHSDGMAKQRIFDAAEDAIIELSKKSRSEVSLPFITIDPKSSQPKHLNEGYSRAVLASAVDDLVMSHVSATVSKDGISEFFSNQIPSPKIYKDVISSVIIKIFEEEVMNPFQLRSVLIVGGAGRSLIYQNALKQALSSIGGEQFVGDVMIIPPDELVEELTVIGSSLFPRMTSNNAG